MDNSLALPHLLEYVEALFKDIAFEYTRRTQMERDKSRLLHELRVRGSRVLTIDLPDVCKHFDKCLNRGLYSPSGAYLGTSGRGMVLPVFTQDLHLQIFDKDGFLREDPSISAISALRQIYKGLSKWRAPCAEWRTYDEVDNFRRIERSLRSATLDWEADDLGVRTDYRAISGRYRFCSESDIGPHIVEPEYGLPLGRVGDHDDLRLTRGLSSILSATADRIAAQFGTFDADTGLTQVRPGQDPRTVFPKHGKGRVSDLRKEDCKYSFPNWPEKLNRSFPFDLYGAVNLNDYMESDVHKRWINHEPPSKLIAVPKTQKGPRLIASEPSSHQWIQQLLWSQIQSKIANTVLSNCITFEDQTKNQELARLGSIDGSFATVDLSSASDRLTCWTLERVLISNESFLTRLHACRTRWIRNAINPIQWDYLPLKKAFTQGNACTFPVQSIVYSIFAIAAVLAATGERVTTSSIERASHRVRVFGDDIIIPEDALVFLRQILLANQLVINDTKTFQIECQTLKGGFRESCGGDYFRGHDVTPVYVKAFGEGLEHEQAVSAMEASNNLHFRGLWRAAEWQLSQIGPKRRELIVHKFGKSAADRVGFGIYSFVGEKRDHLLCRWNRNLLRYEYRSYTLHSKVRKKRPTSYNGLFQYFTERPHPAEKWESGTIVKASAVMRRVWEPTYTGNPILHRTLLDKG